MFGGARLVAAITAGVLFVVGAAAGYWLASGLGEVLVPEKEKIGDYVIITLICGLAPAGFGWMLGGAVYRLLTRSKG
jgi:hypothetical protein